MPISGYIRVLTYSIGGTNRARYEHRPTDADEYRQRTARPAIPVQRGTARKLAGKRWLSKNVS